MCRHILIHNLNIKRRTKKKFHKIKMNYFLRMQEKFQADNEI